MNLVAHKLILKLMLARAHPRGGIPYVASTGTCHCTGYGFWPLCPEQGI